VQPGPAVNDPVFRAYRAGCRPQASTNSSWCPADLGGCEAERY
jgi:hypothetical protein